MVSSKKGGNLKGLWIKGTVTLALLVAVGVGAWAAIDKLDESTFKILTGAIATLIVVVVVGVLFVGYGLTQAYVIRRTIQQDDLNDLRQMAMTARLMGSGRSSVNVKVPEQQQPWLSYLLQPGQMQQPGWIGEYRDATMESEVEIE